MLKAAMLSNSRAFGMRQSWWPAKASALTSSSQSQIVLSSPLPDHQ